MLNQSDIPHVSDPQSKHCRCVAAEMNGSGGRIERVNFILTTIGNNNMKLDETVQTFMVPKAY